MKKSQLRNIIKESIKELVKEQNNGQFHKWRNCGDGQIYTVYVHDHFYPPSVNYPWTPEEKSQNFYVKMGSNSVHQPSGGYKVVPATGTRPDGTPITICWSYIGTGLATPYYYQNVQTSGTYYVSSNSQQTACTNCMNTITNTGGVSYNCIKGDNPKFGSKCVEVQGNGGQFSTKQDCLESGCEPLRADDNLGKELETPLTTTPQSKMIDPEIDRMQKRANIKREK